MNIIIDNNSNNNYSTELFSAPISQVGAEESVHINCGLHRRTGNFFRGGGVNNLPKKISQFAQIFTKESEERRAVLQQHRPFWHMKVA